jgi:hypothetical protein
MFSWKKVKILSRGNGLTNKQKGKYFAERYKFNKKKLLVLLRGRSVVNK